MTKPQKSDKVLPRAYVSVLSTDHFVDGALTLAYSLQRAGARYPFVLFTTPNISPQTHALLKSSKIDTRPIAYIENPNACESNPWKHNYCQLGLLEREEFSKIVYLDLDMIICANIDDLFERTHFSAVSAGSWLPRLSHWGGLNGGLMVIEPSKEEFAKMMALVGTKTKHAGNQGLYSLYFPNWDEHQELHLDHRYNMMYTHLDEYHKIFGFRLARSDESPSVPDDGKRVKVVHYDGPVKPWMMIDKIRHMVQWSPLVRFRARMQGQLLETDSLMLWLLLWDECTSRSEVCKYEENVASRSRVDPEK